MEYSLFMETFNLVLSIILAIIFFLAGVSKASGNEKGLSGTRDVGVKDSLARVVGIFEVLGAFGILLGIRVTAIGWLALVGLWFVMAGAVGVHFRAGKGSTALPAFVLLTALSIALVTI
jgi:uncharacterized membrane protein YphA (DoxX/SURF4 family)